MAMRNLITEAKKLIPTESEIAHAWLDDMLTTHQQLPNPMVAIRFFMLGLQAGGVITLDQWDDFDSLIAKKRPASLH